MMRSLFSGVAGLRTHQTRMDVIGNNIANVNTTAYKSQSMVFSDLMYQTTQAASGANPTTGIGGVNARQIGLGSKTSAIKTNISGQGSAQNTNDAFDLMISGDAFFVVSNGSENFFTRDGSFYIDGKGNLAMTSNGYRVMGWGVDPQNPNNIQKGEVQPLVIMNEQNSTYPAEATTLATVGGIVDRNDPDISNPSGRMMDLEIFDNQGYKYTIRMSVHAMMGSAPIPAAGADPADPTATVDPTKLDKDNYVITDLSKNGQFYVQLDDVIDNGTGKSIMYQLNDDGSVYVDPTTKQKNVITDFKFDGIEPVDGDDTGRIFTLNYVDGHETFENVGGVAGQSGSNTVTFNFAGLPNFPLEDAGGLSIDFSGTVNSNKNGTATITAYAGAEDGSGEGRKIGAMSGINIQQDGKIYAFYDNGQRRLLGQISTATFANPSGLSKEGNNLYSSTLNSGEFDGIGEDITAGGGKMESGVLEMSNVDLAQEFTEMITTQRGFQANSRIITVSDTLLEELTNLKR